MNNIFNVDYNINIPKLVGEKEIKQFGNNLVVEKGLYEKRGDLFYDIILKEANNETFLGRFNKDEKTVDFEYKDGKLLIFQKIYDNKNKVFKIIKVLSLYEVVDRTFYSCTEEEALNLFDPSIDTSNLISKTNSIVRSDVEKRRRLR